jgi:hypothetical protein
MLCLRNKTKLNKFQKFLTTVCNIENKLVSGLCASSGNIKWLDNTTFRKLDLLPSSGEGILRPFLYTTIDWSSLICYLPLTYPVLRHSYSYGLTGWGCAVIEVSYVSLHLRTEADPVPETSCYLVILDFRTMDEVQKPISSQNQIGIFI